MPETTLKEPKNRVKRLFVNESATETDMQDFETSEPRLMTSKYRIVLNCRARNDDSRMKRKIEIGRT